jgi:cysteine desulfurase
MHLDLAGVAASSGSACSTGAVEPSHVLVAMGVSRELALGTIRFSLGRETGPDDVNRAAEVVPAVVSKVRKLAGVLGRV